METLNPENKNSYNDGSNSIITIQEYRNLIGDNSTSNEQVKRRIEYLEALCRNIIRSEIDNYGKETRSKNK